MQGSHLSKTKLVTNGSSYKRFCAAADEEVDDETYDDVSETAMPKLNMF